MERLHNRADALAAPGGSAANDLVHGYLNGAVAARGTLGYIGLLGIASTVFVLVALLAVCAVALRAA